MQERTGAVESLASDAMFQLSTAGMELFHTNLLYWLAKTYPDESTPVWQMFGIGARSHEYTPVIRREWQKIDLFVSPGLGQGSLILENKVGAIPTAKQLTGYRKKLKSHSLVNEGAEWVLLTLTRPMFRLPEPWRSVTYADLLPALSETAVQISGDDGALVAAYARMVERLVSVAAAFDPETDYHGPVLLSPDDQNRLSETRLLSLVEKVRAARLAEQVTDRLKSELGDVASVGAGLSNTTSFNDCFFQGERGRHFGWQVQAGQMRLAVILGARDPKPRVKREALVEQLYSEFFDFELPDDLAHCLRPYTGNKKWLGYEPNFVYRYATLNPNTTWAELTEVAVHLSRRAHAFAANPSTGSPSSS